MEHPAFTLAALCGIGGVAGYVRRGSIPSLAAGLTVGGMYLYAGKLLSENADHGIELASATSFLLIGGSLPRAVRTRKPVPIGLTILGFSALAYYGKKYKDFFVD